MELPLSSLTRTRNRWPSPRKAGKVIPDEPGMGVGVPPCGEIRTSPCSVCATISQYWLKAPCHEAFAPIKSRTDWPGRSIRLSADLATNARESPPDSQNG